MNESIVITVIVCALNIVCFAYGARLGQKVAKGEEIKIVEPIKNPIKEYLKGKEAETEQKKIDTIMQNIETYNGTSAGQKDV